jgi:hypothetical protein
MRSRRVWRRPATGLAAPCRDRDSGVVVRLEDHDAAVWCLALHHIEDDPVVV